jgi:signal transduction histidine kinase
MVGGIEAVRDISARKQAELEIGELNQELKLRADKLAEANRELEAFSYSLSHDLRSYITRISTAQQVLEAASLDCPDAAFPVQAIGESCQGMEDLIEAMLTLSHVTRRGMKVEEVVLSDLAQEIFLELQQQEMERNVEFLLDPGLSVQGDPYLLKLALKNLLENAWKYTRNVPHPRIEFGAEQRQGRRAIFVRDNGIGFSMEEKDKLFAPFQRLQSSRGFPGNGIGLATVERVVLRHGGEIDAEGELGKGATMFVFLPEEPHGSQEERPAAQG